METTELDLQISRLMAVPRAKVWRAWSDPALLAQWWCPKPWMTEVRGFDLRPGGVFDTLMRGPDGGESSNPGLFLEVVPQARLVFTSVLTEGWRPAVAWMPMTAIIEMADEGGGTRYVATVKHLDPETCRKHAEMGFFDGWGTAMTQLEELAATLPGPA